MTTLNIIELSQLQNVSGGQQPAATPAPDPRVDGLDSVNGVQQTATSDHQEQSVPKSMARAISSAAGRIASSQDVRALQRAFGGILGASE